MSEEKKFVQKKIFFAKFKNIYIVVFEIRSVGTEIYKLQKF